jgi:hypothetical protein
MKTNPVHEVRKEDSMQYVMLVRVDPDLPVPEGSDVEPWVEEGARTGMRLEGDPLEGEETATTVRVRDGETLLSDGPFVETKEFVAGYDLLEAPDLETAVDFASRHPVARFGALEVREVWSDFVEDRTGGTRAPVAEGSEYLFVHVPEPERLATITRAEGDPTPWVRAAEDRGVTLGGWRLRDADPGNSATVRVRDGETLITHGPFSEVVEQIAGLDRVRVADLDDALALAAAHPTARIGAIEVRPLVTD